MSAGLSGSSRHSKEVLQRGEVSSAGLWGADECLEMFFAIPKRAARARYQKRNFGFILARARARRVLGLEGSVQKAPFEISQIFRPDDRFDF